MVQTGGTNGLSRRDLPEAFGAWNSVPRDFSRWSQKGGWWRIFEAMADDSDVEHLIIDSAIVTWARLPGPLRSFGGP